MHGAKSRDGSERQQKQGEKRLSPAFQHTDVIALAVVQFRLEAALMTKDAIEFLWLFFYAHNWNHLVSAFFASALDYFSRPQAAAKRLA